jgi:hypothetical protein
MAITSALAFILIGHMNWMVDKTFIEIRGFKSNPLGLKYLYNFFLFVISCWSFEYSEKFVWFFW